MKIIVFSYNREEMLINLLTELEGLDVTVIDDGSDFIINHPKVIKTPHEGKKGFWKKWVIAHQIVLGSEEDYFLFLPDDIKDINLEWLKGLESQQWNEHLFTINVINCGRTECWGPFNTGQEPFEIEDITLNEVGFVDCGFFTNRYTLENIEIHEVHETWFRNENISSGVGAQMSESFRNIRAKMMMPTPSLCYHGKHESKMHTNQRKRIPLQSK
jgi:hypothetical protein